MKELKIESLSHTTGTKVLFDAIDFSIMNEQKVGLIGRNGNGKSTFLKIMAGIMEPDKGQITKQSDYQIAYLNQEPDLDPDATVIETAFSGKSPIMNTVRAYEQAMVELSLNPEDEKIQAKFTRAQQEMDTQDAWNADANAKKILTILGISDMSKKIGKMSGGQQKESH